MRVAVLTALATVSLLGACRQSETPANSSAASNETAPAAASGNSATPAATPVSAEQAQQLFHERHEGMENIGKSNKAIRAALESSSPDAAAINAPAATIADLAAKSKNWFPAGTGQDVQLQHRLVRHAVPEGRRLDPQTADGSTEGDRLQLWDDER